MQCNFSVFALFFNIFTSTLWGCLTVRQEGVTAVIGEHNQGVSERYFNMFTYEKRSDI